MEFVFPGYSHISVDAARCNGKPCIKGTRITVETVLGFLASGQSVDDFVNEYYWVPKEAVMEALGFASRMMSWSLIQMKEAS